MAGGDSRRKEVGFQIFQGLFSSAFYDLFLIILPQGLGTSSDADARDYFSHMEKHMIPFAPTQDGDKELIELAFSKKKADERKEWLRQFKSGTYLDHRLEEIPYSEFINKELILFSMADNIRSIPSVADGLKPGQRKVIWGCFKRKMKAEIKASFIFCYQISANNLAFHRSRNLLVISVNTRHTITAKLVWPPPSST
jgi:DNA topoisomerase-2